MALILFPQEIYVKKITSLTFAFHSCPSSPLADISFQEGEGAAHSLQPRTISDWWRARSPSGWWSNLSSRHLSITGADASLPRCHRWTDLSDRQGGWGPPAPHTSVIFISAALQLLCNSSPAASPLLSILFIFFKQNVWMKRLISNSAPYVTLFSALFYDGVILVFMKGNNG